MADLGGYTDIPETLAEAQAMIVRLLDQLKADAAERMDSQRAQDLALAALAAAQHPVQGVE